MNYCGKSDVGKSRTENQDFFVAEKIDPHCALFAVCDGVGGTSGGEVASSLVARLFADTVVAELEALPKEKRDNLSEVSARDFLLKGLQVAYDELCLCAKSDSALSSMSTTLVAMLLTCSYAFFLNVGDSRAYLYSAGILTQLTKDHSYVQDLVDNGILNSEEASEHAHRNVITRSVGMSADATPDLYKVALSDVDGYTVLLCTDGLTGMVSDDQIRKILDSNGSLRSRAEKLIGAANQNGGLDNITVLLVSEKKPNAG